MPKLSFISHLVGSMLVMATWLIGAFVSSAVFLFSSRRFLVSYVERRVGEAMHQVQTMACDEGPLYRNKVRKGYLDHAKANIVRTVELLGSSRVPPPVELRRVNVMLQLVPATQRRRILREALCSAEDLEYEIKRLSLESEITFERVAAETYMSQRQNVRLVGA
jgi:hypothetical protein